MKFGQHEIKRLTLGQIAELGRAAGIDWGQFQLLHAWCHSMDGLPHVVAKAAGMTRPMTLDQIDAAMDGGASKLDVAAGVVSWCLGVGPDDFPTNPAA